MSRRQLLNISLGSSAVLFVVALVFALTNGGAPRGSATQIDLAKQQVQEVEGLSRTLSRLEDAGDFQAVQTERKELSQAILRFDSNLAALLNGGSGTTTAGAHLQVEAVRDAAARQSLQDGAALWREIGLPLADMAAGEYSIFSAAGQQAVQGLRRGGVDLVQAMETAAQALGQASASGGSQARTAQLIAFLLGGITLALGALRLRQQPQPEVAPRTHAHQPLAPRSQTAASDAALPIDAQPIAPASARPGALTAASGGFEGYRSPVDFDSVNASVDQLSVDMNTIAGSTEKMRLAIESVGHALQGMLFSLNEMAQDTAEGHKVVRGANNAASYTATAAEELTSSAREMAQVVARVTQLAQKTKQVAAQIDAEAVHTGKTGEAFTSVVAAEVKGLASQTSHATAEIEHTVAQIMATTRQYEEAIGQIIKNIAGINKVSQNLGELMLHPPQRVVPGTPLTPAPAVAAPAAVAPPVAAPAAPEPVAEAAPAATPAPAVPEASQAKADEPAFHPAEPAAPAVDPWGGIMDEPAPAEKEVEQVVADTSAAIEEAAAPEPAPAPAPAPEPTAAADDDSKPSGSNANVFMLGGPKKKKAAPAPQTEPEPAPATAPEAAQEEAPAQSETLKDGWGEAPAPAAEAPVAEAEEEEPAGSNIFMLQRPKKKGAAPAAPTVTEPAASADADDEIDEEVTIGAPAEEAEAKPSSNIFMLNKKK